MSDKHKQTGTRVYCETNSNLKERDIILTGSLKISSLKLIRMAKRKFIDIGANLTDRMYAGVYQGSTKHKPDLSKVIERAVANGLDKVGSLFEKFLTFNHH